MFTMIEASRLRELTPWPALVSALERAFRQPCEMPPRQHVPIELPGAPPGTLLLMPAWTQGALLGVKIVQAFPGNSAVGKPSIHGIYMLASATDGEVLALIDAQELTARRTAAASALAARFLARQESRQLLILGTGRLARYMAAAHASVHPIEHVAIWGRNAAKAANVAKDIGRELQLETSVVEQLDRAINGADIITTVTTSPTPVLPGRYLRAGTHVDLVGSFTAESREADDDVIRRSRVFVDSLESAPRESGDLAIPLAQKALQLADLQGDLYGLCSGATAGRTNASEITAFKSVGLASEDLAAASLAWQALNVQPRSRPRAAAADR